MKEFEKNYFVDTNIFIRVLVEDSKKHLKECVEFIDFMEKSEHLKFYISNVVVLEIGWVLKRFYAFPKNKVNNSLRAVVDIKNVSIVNSVNTEKGLDIFEEYNVKLGDAMIVAGDAVQKKKAIIVSYDRDFDKIDGAIRMTPKEILDKLK